ncbi:unnamed protein product [Rhizoctonia solani]|nr:unnamed protein product [Rhizoctonia solani]
MIVHEGHTSAVRSVVFSPDGKSVASGSADQTIRIWHAHNPSSIGEPLRGHSHSIWSVAYSPVGNIIASGSHDQTIRLWDLNTHRHMYQPLLRNHLVYSIAFSPDAKFIASGGGHYSLDSSAFSVQLANVQNMTAAANLFKGHTSFIYSVQFSPQGTSLVSGSVDKTIRIWDVERGTTIVGPLKGHTDSVRSVALSPDGSQILSGSFDHTPRLWDTRSGETIGNPYKGHTGYAFSVAFAPRDTYVASGGGDNTVRLWDIRTGRQVGLFEGHTAWVYSVAFSPCGHYIASGSGDCKVVIRNILGEDKDSNLAHPSESRNIFSRMRAAREMFFWSKMDHPNIHRLQGVIVFRDLWLAMVSEWMDNGNLHQYLQNYPAADRYRLCVHVASGLEYMHSCNTLHGDLKALNVLVSSDGTAKLADFDFSIVHESSTHMFAGGMGLGSLRWAAPELLLEEEPRKTTRSDVYALGMTMLEVFSGEVPYSECRQSFRVLVTLQQGKVPARPVERLKNDNQGNAMWQLLLRCWSRDVSERPSSKDVLDILLSLAGNT